MKISLLILLVLLATNDIFASSDTLSVELPPEWRVYHSENFHQIPLWISIVLNIALIIYIIHLQRKKL